MEKWEKNDVFFLKNSSDYHSGKLLTVYTVIETSIYSMVVLPIGKISIDGEITLILSEKPDTEIHSILQLDYMEKIHLSSR